MNFSRSVLFHVKTRVLLKYFVIDFSYTCKGYGVFFENLCTYLLIKHCTLLSYLFNDISLKNKRLK